MEKREEKREGKRRKTDGWRRRQSSRGRRVKMKRSRWEVRCGMIEAGGRRVRKRQKWMDR